MAQNYRTELRRFFAALNKIDGLYDLFAKRLGANGNHLALFYALDDGAPHSQKQISDEWLIPRTTINTIVREYVDKGYITLLHTDHSKEKQITLTDSGQEYAQQLLQRIYDAEEHAMEATIKAFNTSFIAAVEQFADSLGGNIPQRDPEHQGWEGETSDE